MEIIQIKNLIKKYKNEKKVLDIKGLTVRQGEIFSLLGPNGAGKSTLINILTTYLDYNSGEIKISGKDLRKEYYEIRKKIACVAQNISIDEYLSLKENLIFQGELYGIENHKINESMCAVFKCMPPFSENSQKIYKRFYTEWLPYSGYTYGEVADIEVYPDNNENSMEIWFSIKLKK